METILGPDYRQIGFQVRESSEIAAARRGGNDLARLHGLDETTGGRVALVIMEAATNIVKHASHGEILLRPVTAGAAKGIEIIALDSGPGISNLASSMQDGASTAGSYGVGLGAMRRVADEFDIHTLAGKGSAIRMMVWAGKPSGLLQSWHIGAVCLPMPGEDICGDAWAVCGGAGSLSVLVADGLGHGPSAAKASEAAIGVLAGCPDLPPAAMMLDAHGALRGTRGAAVAIARIDCGLEQTAFAGVGNIAACVIGADAHGLYKRRQLVSHNGIVGSNMRKAPEMTVPWFADATIVLHSDGLGTRWDTDQYPGLAACHPSLVAAVLYRDFSRRRDDVAVLVIRENKDYGL
jgi:anti-sigma regulatory factor (Ser/Thr protein kinase)